MSRAGPARCGTGPADPFGERKTPRHALELSILGARFRFQTDSRKLLEIVRQAYAGLPRHQLGARTPQFVVRLIVGSDRQRARVGGPAGDPPRINTHAAGGLYCGASENSSFAALAPERNAALIVVSAEMLRFPYHVRYELLEFAVYMLASRAQSLVPLHAACIGDAARAILLFGSSGAGKSTLCLHAMLQGWRFLAEDSVLVEPQRLRASGVANFLHLRADSLRFVSAGLAARLRKSPVIRRRSGIEKLEIDLRRLELPLAVAPLRVVAAAFLTPRAAAAGRSLVRLSAAALARRLSAEQPYASRQPGWSPFVRALARLPAVELRRTGHPKEALEELRRLLLESCALESR